MGLQEWQMEARLSVRKTLTWGTGQPGGSQGMAMSPRLVPGWAVRCSRPL